MNMHKVMKYLAGLLASVSLFSVSVAVLAEDKAEATMTFDNLVPIENARTGAAFIDPDADFSVFKRVAILEPYVAFRANWQRDQNRNRSTNIRARDMERIKSDVATLFERVFTDQLEDAGYAVVDEGGEDVLILRPAVIDLDVTAPDNRTAGRSRTFTASSGAATLYIQLLDGHSGNILGRAVDRQVVRSAGNTLTWSNSVTNSADARCMMGRWSDKLIELLDSHYK